ncbi:MAG: hypothetical protein LUD15_15335 [Bacteroides sp.]|nr:hypothetical protein [Bacteroides sp.]
MTKKSFTAFTCLDGSHLPATCLCTNLSHRSLYHDAALRTDFWGPDGVSTWSYSTNGTDFLPCGAPYQLERGYYRGDRIGIYCYTNEDEKGYVDIDFFNYSIHPGR